MDRDPMPVPADPSETLDHVFLAPELDHDEFEHLMSLAGPKYSAELLSRLMADLSSVHQHLVASQVGPDWAVLHAQTHILAAMAGSVGARRLQYLAQAANRLNDTSGAALLEQLMPPMLTQVQTLHRMVAARHAGLPA